MAPHFHDTSLLQNNNLITILNCTQSMCYNDTWVTFSTFFEIVHDFHLGMRVKAGGGFVAE